MSTRRQHVSAAPWQGFLRGVRVVVLGGVSMLLASGAHLPGGGQLSSAGVVVVSGFVLGLVAAVVTARRCRLPVLLLVLGVEQVGSAVVRLASPRGPPLPF
ncbi:MAG: hypothetical protein ACR2LI_10010 [Propionibacteriaceae bacterium]